MKILHTITSLDAKAGGPSRSVPGLCLGLLDRHVDALLCAGATADKVEVSDRLEPYIRLCDGDIFKQAVDKVIGNFSPDIIHSHAIWSVKSHQVSSLARINKISLVIAPRGMLEPWALNTKKWKKKFALLLYQRKDLLSAAALHATAESEALQFRKLGFKQPIIISPNGVSFPDFMPGSNIREDGKKVLLFVSRIHPKKGLVELVDAWGKLKQNSEIADVLRNWHIEFAGPDYEGYLNVVKDRIKKYGFQKDFSYLGVLDDKSKWKAYRRANLFVLPTYSENFGIVVAEALAAGVPVITTKGTPWAELQGSPKSLRIEKKSSLITHHSSFAASGRAGWWIDIGVDPLVQVLQEALSLSDEDRQLMGKNGRKLVETKYSWGSIADDMKSAYEWILNGGEKPDCVSVL